MDVLKGQQVRACACIWFFLKFFIFAIQYRCSSAGNIMERTAKVFCARNIMDMFFYVMLLYTMYLEYTVDSQNCTSHPTSKTVTDGTVTVKVFTKAAGTVNTSDCSYDDFFGARFLLDDSADVMEFHNAHIALLIFLICKELYIYFGCVRRAAAKLKKELENNPNKPVVLQHDDYVRN